MYFPNTSGKCIGVTLVDNCEEYYPSGTTAMAGKCSKCASDFYLNSNSCTERTKKNITGCATLNPSKDSCMTCSNGKFGSPVGVDYTECINAVSNCDSYSVVNVNLDGVTTKKASCNMCSPGYYKVQDPNNTTIHSCEAGNDDKNC
jgi:hypothetical protein